MYETAAIASASTTLAKQWSPLPVLSPPPSHAIPLLFYLWPVRKSRQYFSVSSMLISGYILKFYACYTICQNFISHFWLIQLSRVTSVYFCD